MSKQAQDGICEDCIYYRRHNIEKRDGYGLCHRYAPKPQIANTKTLWPRVQDDDWCGDFVRDGK